MIKNPLLLLTFVLLIRAVILQWFVTEGTIGLGPDEAQYWTWSQLLDWGYYSKPPGIAWQIRAGTAIFGNTELGVRSGAIAIGSLLPFAIYILASTCRLKPWTCFLAAMTFAFTPLGLAASFLAITDGGMVLFWTLSTAAFCRMIGQGMPHTVINYYLIGALVLCGALFKWPIYLFWVFIAIWALIHRQYFNRQLLGGIAISLLGLLPSIIWNTQHGWPTFKHVFSTIHNPDIESGTTDLMRGNFWDFIGAQAILISPLLFILVIISFWGLIQAWRTISPSLQFCGASAFLILLCYSSIAIFKKMQGNWCDFAYPAAMVALCWHACNVHKWRPWIYAGICLSLGMTAFFLSIPSIQANGIVSCCQIPFKSNPFKHNLGWKELEGILINLGYDPKKDFLFADRYQMSSILSFYGPEQRRAYFFNLAGIRNNQFSYWDGMDKEQIGHNGFFVTVENTSHFVNHNELIDKKYSTLLHPYFSKVEYLGEYPLFYSYGLLAKNVYILKCVQYNGHIPPESMLY